MDVILFPSNIPRTKFGISETNTPKRLREKGGLALVLFLKICHLLLFNLINLKNCHLITYLTS